MGVNQKAESSRIAASIVIGISALTLLAGCGGQNSTGTVTGTFQIVTGGVEFRTVPGAGHVIVRDGARRVAYQVSSGSTFTIKLPVGSYRIGATCVQSPFETQLSVPKGISVKANAVTRADVQCLLNPTTG